MHKPAPTREKIHALLRSRWSPCAFSRRSLGDDELRRLFEAARWAPSSFNEQPWRFVIARRQDEAAHARMLACLHERNRVWAKSAPLLALSVARTHFAANGEPNRHAMHDVGLAVGQLTTQATAMGLVLHQIAGFDAAAAREAHAIPEEFEPVAVLAIGYPGDPGELPEKLRKKDEAARERLPLEAIVFEASWQAPLAASEPERPRDSLGDELTSGE
jgi:nitroreductase